MKTYDILNAGPKNRFMANKRIVSNSGNILQPQNLPQNHLPDLTLARDIVKSGDFELLDMMFGNVPNVLSELIRTVLIPREGCRFIVADFSAIEARVLSWLAGEQWRIDTFRNGGDIYCASASQMFHVPVEKHGVNGHLRQKGKISELACIAEGSLVLTDTGLVPIEAVTLSHKLWDGTEWVSHDGVIFKGYREVMTYEGLTATPDHLVWVEGKSNPIQFGYAASCGAHLIQAGNGRKTIRLGEDYQCGETMGQSEEKLFYTNGMSRLWRYTLGKIKRFTIWTFERLSKVFHTKTYSQMVGETFDEGETTVRQSKLHAIQELWGSRYKIRLPKRAISGDLDNRESWSARQEPGNRPDRQQWELCSRKHSFCNKSRKLWKQKNHSVIPIRTAVLALFAEISLRKTIGWADAGTDYTGCRESSAAAQRKLASYKCKARLYDIRNAGEHHRFTVSDKLVHNCGYGGSIGALKSMGAIEMGVPEDELPGLISNWRTANPHIVRMWSKLGNAALTAIREKTTVPLGRISVMYKSGILFIRLPSGRRLSYIKPRIGTNRFGGNCVTYMGIGASKKWERLESFGGKLVENCVQAIARDLLAEAMLRVTAAGYDIVFHVHDEIIAEVPEGKGSVEEMCELMSVNPDWADGLPLNADGYECEYYRKD